MENEWEVFLNPFTPKGDQFQISPAASPEILHHTLWRTWLFITFSDGRWLYYQFSLLHLHFSLLESWENVRFELGSCFLKQVSAAYAVHKMCQCKQYFLATRRATMLRCYLHLYFAHVYDHSVASWPCFVQYVAATWRRQYAQHRRYNLRQDAKISWNCEIS